MKHSIQNSVVLGVASLVSLVSGVALIATAPFWVLALLVFMISMNLLPGTRGAKSKAADGALRDLKVGLPVVLNDLGAVYEARIPEAELPGGDQIAEVGADHIVVRSAAGSETRIPAASIKAVIWTRPNREAEPEYS